MSSSENRLPCISQVTTCLVVCTDTVSHVIFIKEINSSGHTFINITGIHPKYPPAELTFVQRFVIKTWVVIDPPRPLRTSRLIVRGILHGD